MKRRTVLQSIAATAAFLSAPIARAGEKPWKTAVGLNGFQSGTQKYQKTYPIWEVLDFASRNGFDGVELVTDWPMGGYPGASETERIRALKRLYDEYGLTIFSIQNGADGAFDPDPQKRKEWIEQFRDRARLSKTLGCSCMGMWPGGGLRGQTLEQAIDHLAASFREAAVIAGDLGLIVSFEIEPPFVFNAEAHMKAILEKANCPQLKIIYDPSHFDLMNGSTGRPHEMLQRIGVQNVGYVQFTDGDGTLRDGGTSKHLPCGDGHVDIQASLQTLLKGGFKGWIMIDEWEVPDPYDACLKGKKAIETALKQ